MVTEMALVKPDTQSRPPCSEIYIHHELCRELGLIPALVLDIIRAHLNRAIRTKGTASYGATHNNRMWARLHPSDIYRILGYSIPEYAIRTVLNSLRRKDIISMRIRADDDHLIRFTTEFERTFDEFFSMPEHVYIE